MLRALLSLAACASVAVAGEVPVLMWTPSGQLAQVDNNKYSVPFAAVQQQLEDASGEAEALVLFLQDQFSHFDFSRFGGVSGAAFEQLQDAMDKAASQVLPAVEKAGDEIEAAMTKLAEQVQEIANSADVEKLSLNGGRKLVVVRMPSPSKTGKASQFAINDALVGQVTKKVAELTNNKYVAVWTAEKPSEGCNMNFASMSSHGRNRRQAAPGAPAAASQKDFGAYQDRYFSQRIITVMIVVLLFWAIVIMGVFPIMELQSPIRFQDASIPMVGKE